MSFIYEGRYFHLLRRRIPMDEAFAEKARLEKRSLFDRVILEKNGKSQKTGRNVQCFDILVSNDVVDEFLKLTEPLLEAGWIRAGMMYMDEFEERREKIIESYGEFKIVPAVYREVGELLEGRIIVFVKKHNRDEYAKKSMGIGDIDHFLFTVEDSYYDELESEYDDYCYEDDEDRDDDSYNGEEDDEDRDDD